ncbi:MAG: Nif3-like dinuclear metal center hexameric protein [Eubacteriales bacterium]|nr:Nif3-like dinuclear metal center hexameric protein [Eubacteriales bacterium]
MTVKELIQAIEEAFPLDKAVSWDNSGLQTGRRSKEVKKVLVALDATDSVIAQAKEWGADFLLTHHPLTLEGVRTVTSDTLTGGKFFELIQNDICSYAMHTNYDVAEMAQLAGSMMKLQQPEILEVTGVDSRTAEYMGFGRVGSLVRPVTLRECGELVKTIFKLENVKIFGDLEQVVQRVAISPGSGKSMISPAVKAKAQVLITGDIGHHEGIDAVDQGMAVIDAGHYGLEHMFTAQMEKFLKKAGRGQGLEVKQAREENPFCVI